MSGKKKYNLSDLVPYGLLVTKSWLQEQGLSRHLIDNWVKSEQLELVTQGVYKRHNSKLTGLAVVSSLQRMGSDICLGGITALSFQGLGHYMGLNEEAVFHLYGSTKLPLWINKILPATTFFRHSLKKLWGNTSFNSDINLTVQGLIAMDDNDDDYLIRSSSPERAIFEVLLDVPEKISFEHADQLMQGLVNLTPFKINMLLENCHNVKVRRLFLWFAERHNHAWLKKVNVERYTLESGLLGSGKRVLSKGGKLEKKYLITIPGEMYG